MIARTPLTIANGIRIGLRNVKMLNRSARVINDSMIRKKMAMHPRMISIELFLVVEEY